MVILDSHIEGAQMYGPRQRADIYRAIIEYTSYGTEPGWLKGEALGFFVAIRPTLDTQRRRSEAGRRSGMARRGKSEQKPNRPANKTRTKAEQTREQNANEEEVEVERDLPNGKSTPVAPNEPFEEIVGYLNEKANRAYKPTSEATRELIRARLAEGFTVDDFKRVIDNKVASWLGDPKMDEYLRPSTLFQRSKFESYLNERQVKPKSLREVADERYAEFNR